MPLISYRSSVKQAEEGFGIALNARHCLVYGSCDEPKQTVQRFPAIDIVLDADLVLSVSGVHDKQRICAEEMEKSFPMQHLFSFLKTHASELGLSNVSEVYTDRQDGLAKITLSSAHAYKPESNASRLYLRSIDLEYHFRPGKAYASTSFAMFAQQSYLPHNTLLDKILGKFADQLFRLYPLVFGPCCKKLERETTFLLPLSRSLSAIISRTESSTFRNSSRRVTNTLKAQCQALDKTSLKSLVNTGIDPLNTEPSEHDGRHEILACSLLKLLRLHIRPVRFKATSHSHIPQDATVPFQLAIEEASPENASDISSTVLRWEDLPVRSELLSNNDTTLEEIVYEDTDDNWYEDDAQNEDDWLSDSSELHIYCDHEDVGYSSDISDEDFEDEPPDATMHSVDSPPSSPTMFMSSQGSTNYESEPRTPVDHFVTLNTFLDEDEDYLPFDENDPPPCEDVSYPGFSSQLRINTGAALQELILDGPDDSGDALSGDCGDADWLSEMDDSFDDVEPLGFYQEQTCDDHDVIL